VKATNYIWVGAKRLLVRAKRPRTSHNIYAVNFTLEALGIHEGGLLRWTDPHYKMRLFSQARSVSPIVQKRRGHIWLHNI
jgi:hypothetical protein